MFELSKMIEKPFTNLGQVLPKWYRAWFVRYLTSLIPPKKVVQKTVELVELVTEEAKAGTDAMLAEAKSTYTRKGWEAKEFQDFVDSFDAMDKLKEELTKKPVTKKATKKATKKKSRTQRKADNQGTSPLN